MTAIYVPERVQQLAAAVHLDRARLIACEREEQDALARAEQTEGLAAKSARQRAEAERKLAALQEEIERLTAEEAVLLRDAADDRQTVAERQRERAALEREVEAGTAMLAGAEQLLGYTVPAPPAPSELVERERERVTPPQGTPVVRVAETVPDADPTRTTVDPLLVQGAAVASSQDGGES